MGKIVNVVTTSRQPQKYEMEIIDELFESNQPIYQDYNIYLVVITAVVLFGVVNLGFIDLIISKITPSASGRYTLLLIKMIIFGVLLFIATRTKYLKKTIV